MDYKIMQGNNLVSIKELEDNSIDSIVTDPPYGLSFMGKKWDYDVPSVEIWKECLRVLKPGGHLLAFAGTRTQHRMAVNIEDAGFEIRDMIMYVYGSGFPKSHNIEKALNKIGNCGIMVVEEVDENEIQRTTQKSEHNMRHLSKTDISQTKSNQTSKGKVLQHELPKYSISFKNEQLSSNVWEGQSSLERWNYLQTSEGQLQRCKVCEMSKRIYINGEERWLCDGTQISNGKTFTKMFDKEGSCTSYRPQSSEQQNRKLNAIPKQYKTQDIRRANEEYKGFGSALKPACEPITIARKPIQNTLANNVLKYGTGGINIDGCRVGTAEELGRNNHIKPYGGTTINESNTPPQNNVGKAASGRFPANFIHDGSDEIVDLLQDSARYFYCAKCSKKDRNEGLDEFDNKLTSASEFRPNHMEKTLLGEDGNPFGRWTPTKNNHPTVKPTSLMQYLVRLVTPKGGTVLDPFMGSGSTGKACMYEGFNFIGMELDEEYCKIAEARIKFAKDQKKEEQMNIFEVI